jgi:hypothetical protein
VFLVAGLRYARMKAPLMSKNYDLVAEIGGPEEAKRLAFAQEGRAAKIAFMKRFQGIGDKYARNIWMDSYHPDFRDAVVVDERINKVTEALGYSFAGYDEHERFYQGVAAEVGLESWEVDRLLYNHLDEFLTAIRAGGEEHSTNPIDGVARQQGESLAKESSEGVAKEHRLSTTISSRSRGCQGRSASSRRDRRGGERRTSSLLWEQTQTYIHQPHAAGPGGRRLLCLCSIGQRGRLRMLRRLCAA